jgi:hypothetical protein
MPIIIWSWGPLKILSVPSRAVWPLINPLYYMWWIDNEAMISKKGLGLVCGSSYGCWLHMLVAILFVEVVGSFLTSLGWWLWVESIDLVLLIQPSRTWFCSLKGGVWIRQWYPVFHARCAACTLWSDRNFTAMCVCMHCIFVLLYQCKICFRKGVQNLWLEISYIITYMSG